MILSQAIIADIVPARERAKYMGPIGALFGLSAIAGPLVGGFFTDHASLGWEWAFWINVPVGIAVLAIGWFALTLPRKRSTTPVDYAGIVALSATTTSLIFFTDFGGRDGWASWQALSLLAAFIVSVGVVRGGRAARGGADHPDDTVPQPDVRRRHRARRGGRAGHVLGDRLHAHVPADELRAVGRQLRPARCCR